MLVDAIAWIGRTKCAHERGISFNRTDVCIRGGVLRRCTGGSVRLFGQSVNKKV